MFLIADSGSTKTDWAVVDGGCKVATVHTQGINPFHMSVSDICQVLESELLSLLPSGIDHVFFYGSGCTPTMCGKVAGAIRKSMEGSGVERIEVESDLVAVARALCQRHDGIACILGTGANSCLYDGKKIVANTPPLGYILGDEGSGAVLGRLFLNGIFKGWLSECLRDDYLKWSGMSYEDVIERVYRKPLANRFLASIVPFVALHVEEAEVKAMIKQGFRSFIQMNVASYGRKDLPIGFIGGVAWQFRQLLREVVDSCGYVMGNVEKTPMEGLIRYHSQLEIS